MSYTPPGWSGVDFDSLGWAYSPPSWSAVDFTTEILGEAHPSLPLSVNVVGGHGVGGGIITGLQLGAQATALLVPLGEVRRRIFVECSSYGSHPVMGEGHVELPIAGNISAIAQVRCTVNAALPISSAGSALIPPVGDGAIAFAMLLSAFGGIPNYATINSRLSLGLSCFGLAPPAGKLVTRAPLSAGIFGKRGVTGTADCRPALNASGLGGRGQSGYAAVSLPMRASAVGKRAVVGVCAGAPTLQLLAHGEMIEPITGVANLGILLETRASGEVKSTEAMPAETVYVVYSSSEIYTRGLNDQF